MTAQDPRRREDLERLERARATSAFVVRDGPMERRISFEAGYDHTGFDCGHGRHGMGLRFVLIGPAGAVQWLCYMSNWVPGHVRLGHVDAESNVSLVPIFNLQLGDGLAADLGYHSAEPTYAEQPRVLCDLLPKGHCYYDGSGLNAEPVLEAFLAHGPMAVWAALARYYAETFTPAVEADVVILVLAALVGLTVVMLVVDAAIQAHYAHKGQRPLRPVDRHPWREGRWRP